MKLNWRTSKYIWIACAAGWTVIYISTQVLAAMLPMVGSIAVATLCQFMEDRDGS